MTPEEKEAIRARHVPVAGLRDDEGHMFEPATFCRACARVWPCDRRALLAEVDRLAEELDDMTDTAAFYLAERERIRAGVEKLPVRERDKWSADRVTTETLDRADVMRVLDGKP